MRSPTDLRLILLLASAIVAGGWSAAQVVPPPLASPAGPRPALSPRDRALIEPLPLLERSETERTFDKQLLRIEIFRFASPEASFSAFTCMQMPGAKSYQGLADCVVQGQEMVSWKGSRVTRTTFPDISRARLSAYAGWIRDQFRQGAPIPELYMKFPDESLISPSRRYLVRDSQAGQVWPGFPPGYFSLDRGNRLLVGRYRSSRHEYWGGWLVAAGGPAMLRPVSPDGHLPDDPGKRVFRSACDGGVCSVYLGPDDPELAADVLQRFKESARANSLTAEVDTNRFFRRDQYTYPDVILTGFRLVFFLLAGAFAAGLVIGAARAAWQKLLRRKTGLAAETVVHLRLDAGRGGVKNNHTPRREIQ